MYTSVTAHVPSPGRFDHRVSSVCGARPYAALVVGDTDPRSSEIVLFFHDPALLTALIETAQAARDELVDLGEALTTRATASAGSGGGAA